MTKNISPKRVFFGIPICETVYFHLKKSILQNNLKMPEKLSWIAQENCHMTLRFLGNIEEALILPLIEIAMSELKQFKKFEIHIEKIDHFPNGRSSLIAAHVAKSTILKDLFSRLDKALIAANFPREAREYKPHITLIRNKSVPSFHILPIDMENYSLFVEEVILYESVSQRGGSQYLPLQRFSLL